MEQGYVHLYYGDGKGKTTCAMGLCLRAAGAGKRVLIHQFLKDNSSSERHALAQLSGVTVVDGLSKVQFTFRMTAEQLQNLRTYSTEKFEQFIAMSADFDLLFMDEILHLVAKGLLDEQMVVEFLQNKPPHLEVVLTGHAPSMALRDCADYITQMKKEKHPYDQGVASRVGIEY